MRWVKRAGEFWMGEEKKWLNNKRTQVQGQMTKRRDMRERVKKGKWIQREEGVKEKREEEKIRDELAV